MLEAALRSLACDFDLREAGFGTGAKFPQTPALDWLLGSGPPRAMTGPASCS